MPIFTSRFSGAINSDTPPPVTISKPAPSRKSGETFSPSSDDASLSGSSIPCASSPLISAVCVCASCAVASRVLRLVSKVLPLVWSAVPLVVNAA
ncbi:MAG: hypothetical protein HY301_21275 [Verrucomicrobia bacterium]|nr:hypothetical protein [Verrucomicrobiota bacterium]